MLLGPSGLGVHESAVAAGVRRACGPDGDEANSGLAGLVGEHCEDFAPALLEDGAVEARLGPDVSAGVGWGASGGRGHVGDLQVLDGYEVFTLRLGGEPDDFGIGLVLEVVSEGIASLVQVSQGFPGLEVVLGGRFQLHQFPSGPIFGGEYLPVVLIQDGFETAVAESDGGVDGSLEALLG